MMALLADLQRLDALVHREILRLRAAYQLSLDEFRGLYVSDEQVDALLRASLLERNGHASGPVSLDVPTIERPPDSPLAMLGREFSLSELELDAVLAAAAPELDPKYETLYAYLNNDVSKKAATADLISRLLRGAERSTAVIRSALLPRSPLFTQGLLSFAGAPERASSSNMAITANRSVCACLLGLDLRNVGPAEPVTERPPHESSEQLAAALKIRLGVMACANRLEHAPALWVFHGRDARLRSEAAAHLCRELNDPQLRLDLATSPPNADEISATLRYALIQQRLLKACLSIVGVERHIDAEGRLPVEIIRALRVLREAARPVLVDAENLLTVKNALPGVHLVEIEVPELSREERAAVWCEALRQRDIDAPAQAVEQVTHCFALTVQQIENAAQVVADEGETALATAHLLADAARRASDHSLASIAQRLERRFELKDVVLPSATFRRLQDVVYAVRNRHLVFGDWGLARRAGGSGLRVLFAGPSGTGKTMAASAVARELGVDIYRIDISQTVSKYIGETEKNLDRIFHAALYSNAILFFDEADALFGKRSEVKDAHDRYSNIETAYLLQKIEEYPGVVLLASNLSRNMDSAFSRRLSFVLEFPLPEKADREKLWRGMLSCGVPVAGDLDVGFLATQFALTGGEIRNVVLDAAFLAAQDARHELAMKHVVIALGRQLTKQGRVPSITDFKHHHELLTER